MSVLYPETFKEICESVLEETDGRAVAFASVALGRDSAGDLHLENPTHRNIVKWVAEVYTQVQVFSPFWEFLHKRGKFLTVVADKDSYSKTSVREVVKGSAYFIKTGSTTRQPVCVQDYEWWVQQERYTTNSSSTPQFLIKAPDNEWLLWPTPSSAGALYAEWFVEPFELLNADDEPCWNRRYNGILKWLVIRQYAKEFVKEGSSEKLMARAQQALPGLVEGLMRDYLPQHKGMATFF